MRTLQSLLVCATHRLVDRGCVRLYEWSSRSTIGRAFFVLLALFPSTLHAADYDACRQLLVTGKYEACIAATSQAIAERQYGDRWHVLKAEAQLTLGRYKFAQATVTDGLKHNATSIRLRHLGYTTLLRAGQTEQARKLLGEIDDLATRAPWRYTDTENLITLGESALLIGAGARDVLEGFYDKARSNSPDRVEPLVAIAELALTKDDRELATEILQRALKKFPDHPGVHFGLARALSSSEPQRAASSLAKALSINPRHMSALLLQTEQAIDAERYADALTHINQVHAINRHEPRAWAYRAVLAHLEHDTKGEVAFRAAALAGWQQNPAVDYLIGRKLSQKYRFAEGAIYQRRALEFDTKYLPARRQLCQDLLRLGKEGEGWELADALHKSDGYDVTTFNLLELRDRIASFRTLENEDFIVRMEAREAAVYGDRVLELLGRAKKTLCEKYGLELRDKITVEIFPDTNDFAVRTFGMPGASGYLGVCFGKVITANSPASRRGRPTNWEAVLWHEFCHVVTLELTNNRMPRWLSEGISVYEESQENSTWGQRMNPTYRRMILEGKLTPISQLSGAFLSPASGLHLQFAYYESSLVVEFLIDRYGLDALKLILRDLASGLPIGTAIERRTASLAKLETDFAAFATGRARSLAPKADWTQPDLAALLNDDGDALADWVAEHPHNPIGLTALAQQLIENGKLAESKRPLQTLLTLYPGDTSADNAHRLLASVHKTLRETAAERKLLESYSGLDADCLDIYRRSIELEEAAGNWPLVLTQTRRALAVDPLVPEIHRARAVAAEKMKESDEAIAAYRVLLSLEPQDLALVHYRLASLLHQKNDPTAKRHVLAALEQAPRYRAAHRLLLRIVRSNRATTLKATNSGSRKPILAKRPSSAKESRR